MWRGVEGVNREERRLMVEKYAEGALGREIRIREIGEVKGENERIIVIVEMKKEEDRKELLEKERLIWKKWGVGVKDLTAEERKLR